MGKSALIKAQVFSFDKIMKEWEKLFFFCVVYHFNMILYIDEDFNNNTLL